MEVLTGCWKDKSKGNRYLQNSRGINYLLTFAELLYYIWLPVLTECEKKSFYLFTPGIRQEREYIFSNVKNDCKNRYGR